MILFSLLSIASAVPVEMVHQGELVGVDGTPASGSQILMFKIYGEESGGTELWTETVVVNAENGFYSATLGETIPLDSTLLQQYPLFLELTVGSNPAMSPRQSIGSVPYAVISEVAESVDGGVVNASEVQINGVSVIDASGNWVGSGGTGGTGGSGVQWGDIVNVPTYLQDGDDDTLASLNCNNGEVLGWDGGQWVCLAVSGTSGTGGATLTESQVETYITNDAIDLNAQTTINGETILTENSVLTVDWSNVDNKPSGFADNFDNDTLSSLNCNSGETVIWNATLSSWLCAPPSTSGGGSSSTALSTEIGSSDGGIVYTNLDGSNSVPDGNAYGFTSARYIADSFSITTFTIDVEMTHPDVGEVTLKLTSPAGTEIIIYDKNFPGQVDMNTTFGWENDIHGGNRYAFYGEDVSGIWTLNVIDPIVTNNGVVTQSLDSWTLHFNETWDGELTVGHQLTVQENLEVRKEVHLSYGAELVFSDIHGVETSRFNGSTGIISNNNIYTANATDSCSNATAYCDSGDIAISGGCIQSQTYGYKKNTPVLNASGSPEGWQCELYSSCYNVEATVICLDVTPN